MTNPVEPLQILHPLRAPPKCQKGGFVISGGFGEYALVPVLCTRFVPSFRFLVLYNVQIDAAVLGDRLPEGTQKPLLGPGSPSLQCRR